LRKPANCAISETTDIMSEIGPLQGAAPLFRRHLSKQLRLGISDRSLQLVHIGHAAICHCFASPSSRSNTPRSRAGCPRSHRAAASHWPAHGAADRAATPACHAHLRPRAARATADDLRQCASGVSCGWHCDGSGRCESTASMSRTSRRSSLQAAAQSRAITAGRLELVIGWSVIDAAPSPMQLRSITRSARISTLYDPRHEHGRAGAH
jgi:hypothetical protein